MSVFVDILHLHISAQYDLEFYAAYARRIRKSYLK